MAYPTVDSLAPGHHIFFTYASDAEQIHVLVDFVRQGLERRERVYYFADRDTPSEIAARLRRRGIDIDRATGEGRLILGAAKDSYLATGRFDAGATKAGWFEAIAQSAARGYAVMRIAADMSWAARYAPGSDELADYERSLADVFATKRVIGLCEFDGRIFEQRQLEELGALHDVALDVHPVCKSDELKIYFTASPDGAAIDGEVDVSNREAFVEALEVVLETLDGDIYLDVSNLRFIDAGGLGAIVHASKRLRPGTRLVLHGLQPYLRRIMMLMGWEQVPGLTF